MEVCDTTTRAALTGEYRKEEVLEAARTGNEEKLVHSFYPLSLFIQGVSEEVSLNVPSKFNL